MKISELLKEKATISFEVFPPKNKEGDISSIYYTIEELAKLDPDFISVTYGAGGSSKGKTVEIASAIKNKYQIESVAHLSCITSTKEDILTECRALKEHHSLCQRTERIYQSKFRGFLLPFRGMLSRSPSGGRLFPG